MPSFYSNEPDVHSHLMTKTASCARPGSVGVLYEPLIPAILLLTAREMSPARVALATVLWATCCTGGNRYPTSRSHSSLVSLGGEDHQIANPGVVVITAGRNPVTGHLTSGETRKGNDATVIYKTDINRPPHLQARGTGK